MKRFLVVLVPTLGTFTLLGLGLVLFRGQSATIRSRFAEVRATVAGVAEDVAEEIGEAREALPTPAAAAAA